jgi:glutamyl-tRNA(Gln) amidotransferase subunit D
MADAGDRVKVVAKDEAVEGVLMPSEGGKVVVKLESGYNIGIDKKKIKEIKVLEKYKKSEPAKAKVEAKKGLPTIAVLHTGGTIASKVDYRTGGVVARFSPEELLEMFPELKEIANIKSELIRNMFSDDLRFDHFSAIANAVEKEVKKGIDGIIVSIGTDNLAVASAALAFILEKCPIPVILVGAQRSSDRGSSDAAANLICAANFIAKTDFAGVAVCMHENTSDNTCVILPACKTRKLHSSRRDAFKPVNDIPIAKVNYETKKIEFLKKNYLKKSKELSVKPKMEQKVGLLKITVNMFPEQFLAYKGYKGLIIEGTGLGHTPLHVVDESTKIHEKIKDAIKTLVDSGTIVVMTIQCLFGRVGMEVYSKGRDLQKLGVISGEDMLPETAFVKLAWLLGNYPKEKVKELVGKNLRGEISERTDIRSTL